MRRNLNSFKLVPQQSSLWNWWQINSYFNSFHSINSSFYLVLSFSHLLKHVYLLKRTNICYVEVVSDVMPTDRWLSIWCIWYTYLETLQECRSRRWIGWKIQDFRETCVSCFFIIPPGNENASHQPPSQNMMANAYQGQWNGGFSKVCESEIFKVQESLKYIWEFHTLFFLLHINKKHWCLLFIIVL